MESMQTIVETAAYLDFAEKHLTSGERTHIVSELSKNPRLGDLIQGTGGIRKARFPIANKGKSGGVRIIHYFYNETMPLFILFAYTKAGTENLTKSERNELAKLVKQLRAEYENKNKNLPRGVLEWTPQASSKESRKA